MKKILNVIRLLFGGYVDGYNRKGFDRKGYDRQGYDKRGFNKKRKHKVTGGWYDTRGYNYEGFDADGEHMDYAHLKGKRISVIGKGIIQVDLHGMSVKAAVRFIEAMLDCRFDNDIRRLVIIHGYSHGSILKSTIQSFDHPGIREILVDSHNEGMTIFELN